MALKKKILKLKNIYMKNIIIKLPDKRVKKFRLQGNGWKSRRFLRAATLLNRLESVFSRTKLDEKTAIVIKEYIGSHFVNINESLSSNDSKYLLYTLVCFLEDFLSEQTLLNMLKKHGPKT